MVVSFLFSVTFHSPRHLLSATHFHPDTQTDTPSAPKKPCVYYRHRNIILTYHQPKSTSHKDQVHNYLFFHFQKKYCIRLNNYNTRPRILTLLGLSRSNIYKRNTDEFPRLPSEAQNTHTHTLPSSSHPHKHPLTPNHPLSPSQTTKTGDTIHSITRGDYLLVIYFNRRSKTTHTRSLARSLLLVVRRVTSYLAQCHVISS